MNTEPTLKSRILDHLQEYGPMRQSELCEYITDRKYGTVYLVLRELQDAGKVRVKEWIRNYGKGGRFSPVWMIADGQPNKGRPRVNARQEARRNYDRKMALLRALRKQHKTHGEVNPFYQAIFTPRRS